VPTDKSEAAMFSFLKKRILKEHMKLVAQNYSALQYLNAFLPPAASQHFGDYLQEVNSAWNPGERLSDDVLRRLLSINKDLRRAYDASPARAFGMKAFDDEFRPLMGWDDYYSQHL
jgi:hypothetical protein